MNASGAGADGGVRNEVSGVVGGPLVMAGTIETLNVHIPHTLDVVPRQLRRLIDGFVNRTSELADVAAAVDAGRIVVLWGLGGVGKTQLAIRWFQANQSRFPDGQLHVDLGGSTDAHVTPEAALSTLLRSLGVSPETLPTSVVDLRNVYLSLTAGKRIGLLLDNAATAAQVAALLPASSDAVVVVTSRSQLTGLRIQTAFTDVPVEALDETAALDLLRHVLGVARLERETPAAKRLVALCGWYPLALAIIGARLAARPRLAVATVTEELADGRRRLAHLVMPGDIPASVPAAFDLSYTHLTAPAAGLYRALGLHPTPVLSLAVAAAAAGVDETEAEAQLVALTESTLLIEADHGRWRFLDLVWLHARERAMDEEPESVRAAVIRRILGCYLRQTAAADLVVKPLRWREGSIFQQLAGQPSAYPDRDAALAFLERERTNLVAAVMLADQPLGDGADRDAVDELAWQLCVALWGLLFERKYYPDWLATHTVGIAAARRLGDRIAEAKLLCQRGFAYLDTKEHAAATADFEAALQVAEAAGHRQARSTAVESLGLTALDGEQFARALDRFDQALVIALEPDDEHPFDRLAFGLLVQHRGRALSGLGRYPEAVTDLATALRIMREPEIADRYNEGRVLTNLGKAHRRAGQVELAIESLQSALAIMRGMSTFQTAEVAVELADIAQSRGAVDTAREHLAEALSRYRELHAPQATIVADRLAALPPTSVPDPGQPG